SQAPYLLELADRRILAARMSDAGNAQFNVRASAMSSDFLSGTVIGDGSWQAMLNFLWQALPSGFGTTPTLPYSPHGSPNSFRWIGSNAWELVNCLLDRLSCIVNWNPITDTYTISKLGTQDYSWPTDSDGNPLLPEYNAEPLEPNPAKMPGIVRVYFHRHYR